MNVRYLVVGVWTDKETGDPCANLCEITEGIGKKSGKHYAFADTENKKQENRTAQIGDIVSYNMTEVAAAPTVSQTGIKINPKAD
jgi:uncharacterized protein (UPF0218 family)